MALAAVEQRVLPIDHVIDRAEEKSKRSTQRLPRGNMQPISDSNRFYIETDKILGKGSYSFVYEAKDLVHGEPVVAKVTSLAEKTHVRCHRGEIEAFKRLGNGHNNIVKFYDDFIQDKCGVLVLEQLSSFTLEDYIYDHGRMDFLSALEIFSEILSAVEFMHSVNLSPRDLKTENIAFELQGNNIKIFDLGLAAILDPGADGEYPMIKSTTGSPLYMAPEVLGMKAHNSFVHDIWCLGQILYTMLVGHCPFHSCTNMEELRDEVLIYRKILYPPTLEYKATMLLKGMLEWDPSKRMTLDEVQDQVDDLLCVDQDFN